ncbi:nitroreductase family protein [Bacillus kwashiorkori]|uniref:nitroreductase family protein n=1 Tax=Bacillus kwashiorkori TaxID=1522318 RepID=UPI0007851A73|nr:nitroreductase family protein [Bacillus kwashiorkori]
MSSFLELVRDRRSASNFLPNNPISEEQLQEIFEIVKLSPSAYNLQHAHYIAIRNPDVKEKLYVAANKQYKVLSSSAVIIVLGDKKAFYDAATIYSGLKLLGIVDEQEYEYMVNDTVSFYESRGDVFHKEEAIRNGSISAMMFMLAAKEYGWDSCPMIGFDQDEVRKILSIDPKYEIVMMITLGKEKIASRKPRGYRKPVNEFVSYI